MAAEDRYSKQRAGLLAAHFDHGDNLVKHLGNTWVTNTTGSGLGSTTYTANTLRTS